jgi:succinyl-diaminopimelate desuccinylase
VSQDELAGKLYRCFSDSHGKGAGINPTEEAMEIVQSAQTAKTVNQTETVSQTETVKQIEVGVSSKFTAQLTLNLGILKIKNGVFSAQVDCRYPHGITSDWLTDKMQQTLHPYQVQLAYDDKPTLSDLNSPYVQVLLNTYREVTKDDQSEPFISGGVTYSKAIRHCVAFGPGLLGEEALAHQKNERISTKNIDLLFELYTKTMISLANQ